MTNGLSRNSSSTDYLTSTTSDIQRTTSVNDKADLLQRKLQNYHVALEVMAEFPYVMEIFKERISTK